MLRKLAYFLICFSLIIGISNTSLIPGSAQDVYPPTPSNQLLQNSNGEWFMTPQQEASIFNSYFTPKTIGSPDEFGYIWDDSASFAWIDATVGTDTAMSNYSCAQAVGPISLPFSFNFYENSYAQIWINAGGYITFSAQDAGGCGPNGTRFPEPGFPANLIAPLWSRLTLANDGTTNRVFYSSGGSAPNRYFVVEWNQVEYSFPPLASQTIFTFEVILYENGDFRFQYQTIDYPGSYYCDDIAIGIENANGYDGMPYLDYCDVPASGTAVLFTRPTDSARISLLNPYDGTFTQPHQSIPYELQIVNTGTLGPDRYNLTTTSTWNLVFKNTNGIPLTDTNADGIIDTSLVAQGETLTVVADVQTPTIINPMDENNMHVTITSVNNPSKSEIATLQAAVPIPFVQTFQENGMGLYLVKPDGQEDSMISNIGGDMSVEETPDQGFVYVWDSQHWLDDSYTIAVSEIEYTLLDQTGLATHAATILTDNSAATFDTYDDNPTVAVAPNGYIGVLWDKWLVNETWQRNYNIFFAILSPSGDVSFGPVNITNYTEWGDFNELNIPHFSGSSIAATDDNHFLLSWHQEIETTEDDWNRNIAYSIRNTNGAELKSITLLTDDVVGAERVYSNPSVGQLDNQMVLISYLRTESGVTDLYFTVLDSNGNIIKTMTNLSTDGSARNEIGRADIAQFSDGNIAVAWNTNEDTLYTVIDSNFNRIVVPASVSHPAMRSSPYYPISYFSLAEDTSGHVALTWSDPDIKNSRNLYYALLDSNGSIRTPPMIFRTSESQITTGTQGYASSTYTFNPTTTGVDTEILAPASVNLPLDGTTTIPIQFGNNGSTLATNVIITATFSDALTYLGDNSGVLPSISSADNDNTELKANTTITWTFSTGMTFLGSGQFDLYLGTGNAEIGNTYPVIFTISTAESEDLPVNNTFFNEVTMMGQIFLPMLLR